MLSCLDMVTNKKPANYYYFYKLIPGHNNLQHPSSLPTHKHTQYTSTTTPSFYCGFTSLKRCLGSLGIAIVILGHVLYFLYLTEVDSLWSRWECESKTCTKTRQSTTAGWCHADVIFQRETCIVTKWVAEIVLWFPCSQRQMSLCTQGKSAETGRTRL